MPQRVPETLRINPDGTADSPKQTVTATGDRLIAGHVSAEGTAHLERIALAKGITIEQAAAERWQAVADFLFCPQS